MFFSITIITSHVQFPCPSWARYTPNNRLWNVITFFRATTLIERRRCSFPQLSARHHITLQDRGYGTNASRVASHLSLALTVSTRLGMARLSWSGTARLVTYRDDLPSAEGHLFKY